MRMVIDNLPLPVSQAFDRGMLPAVFMRSSYGSRCQIDLIHLFPRVKEAFNEHYKDFHADIEHEKTNIKSQALFFLGGGRKESLRGQYSRHAADVYCKLLSPMETVQDLEKLIRVGNFISHHPNRDKSRHLLGRYEFVMSLMTEEVRDRLEALFPKVH